LACHPAGTALDPKIALAAGRAWVTDPVLMYPWTSGVAGLVIFLIGALAARKRTFRRRALVAAAVWIVAFVAALLLGQAATNCR